MISFCAFCAEIGVLTKFYCLFNAIFAAKTISEGRSVVWCNFGVFSGGKKNDCLNLLDSHLISSVGKDYFSLLVIITLIPPTM